MATDGVQMIADERLRQLEVEGWDADHDRGHSDEIAMAAAAYAVPARLSDHDMAHGPLRLTFNLRNAIWPWLWQWWKPTPDDRVRELVKAGALIAAAIDSLLDEGYETKVPRPDGYITHETEVRILGGLAGNNPPPPPPRSKG